MSPRRSRRARKKNIKSLEKCRVDKRKFKSDDLKERTANWINGLSQLKKKHEKMEVPPDFSDESEIDEMDVDLFELEKPLAESLKGYSKDEIKRSVLFECEWKKCPFEIDDEEQFHKHVKDHSMEEDKDTEDKEDEAVWVCLWDVCKFKTADRKEFIRHVNFHSYHSKLKTYGSSLASLLTIPQCQLFPEGRNKIPKQPTDYFCHWDDCGETFIAIQDFFDHVHYHLRTTYPLKKDLSSKTLVSKRAVICLWNQCQKNVYNVYKLKEHLTSHIKQSEIACPTCGAMLKTKRTFIDHCLRQTVTSREYQCPSCYKFFPTLKLMQDHEKHHVNFFKCTLCDMSCSSKGTLALHIRYRHVTDRPYACDQCEYRSVQKRDLQIHMNVHKEGNPFKCDQFMCKFSCRTAKTLRNHARQHDSNQQVYKCHVDGCDKEYSCGNILSRHLIKKHGYKLPSGHSRFVYRMDFDGFYRLQTKRIESVEVTKQILNSSKKTVVETPTCSYSIKEVSNGTSEGISIQVEPETKEKDVTEKTPETAERPVECKNSLRDLLSFDDDDEKPIKKITDFTVMRRYIKTAPVVVEIEEKDQFGETISKEIIEVNEYQINKSEY